MPYNASSRSNNPPQAGDANPAQDPQMLLLPGPRMRPPCPRQGIQWIASRLQPQAAWDRMEKPHEVANTSVVNFLYTLTAFDIKDNISRTVSSSCYANSLLQPHTLGSGQCANRLSRLAMECKDMDYNRNTYDFRFMIALIRLSFECAR